MTEEKAIDRCNELIKLKHANWIGISNQEAIRELLNMLKEKDKEIEHQIEKRNNQKAELAILNEKQKEMNKLINTVKSYKGQMKKETKRIKSLEKEAQGYFETTIIQSEQFSEELKEKDKEISNLKIEIDEAWEEWNNLERGSYEEKTRLKDEIKKKDKKIEKLKKESEHWKNAFERELEDNRKNTCELLKQDLIIRKKEKQIDLMAEYIETLDTEEDICMKNKTNPEWCNEDYTNCKECVKQYFKSKVEKE